MIMAPVECLQLFMGQFRNDSRVSAGVKAVGRGWIESL